MKCIHLNVLGSFRSNTRGVSSRWQSRNCYMCGGFGLGFFFPISKVPLLVAVFQWWFCTGFTIYLTTGRLEMIACCRMLWDECDRNRDHCHSLKHGSELRDLTVWFYLFVCWRTLNLLCEHANFSNFPIKLQTHHLITKQSMILSKENYLKYLRRIWIGRFT